MKKIVLLLLASLFVFSACIGSFKKYTAEEARDIYEDFYDMDSDELVDTLEDSGYEKGKFSGEKFYVKEVNGGDSSIVMVAEGYAFYVYVEGASAEDALEDLDEVFERDGDEKVIISYGYANRVAFLGTENDCEIYIDFDDDEYYFEYGYDGDGECSSKSVEKSAMEIFNKSINEMESVVSGANGLGILGIILVVLNFILIITAVLVKLLVREGGKLAGTIISIVCLVLALLLLILGRFGLILSLIVGLVWLLATLGVVLLIVLGRKSKPQPNI